VPRGIALYVNGVSQDVKKTDQGGIYDKRVGKIKEKQDRPYRIPRGSHPLHYPVHISHSAAAHRPLQDVVGGRRISRLAWQGRGLYFGRLQCCH
jgi:hypothetical protein